MRRASVHVSEVDISAVGETLCIERESAIRDIPEDFAAAQQNLPARVCVTVFGVDRNVCEQLDFSVPSEREIAARIGAVGIQRDVASQRKQPGRAPCPGRRVDRKIVYKLPGRIIEGEKRYGPAIGICWSGRSIER